ncbi:MAG TPA: cellulase family glycosylhydrolase [Acidimicrobiales bacterium]|nr:cellulase family glycosylhydrolase [Acidimicrobiales bacterium]
MNFIASTGGWVVKSGTLSLEPASTNALLGALAILPVTPAGPTSAFSGSPQNGGLTPATPGALYSGTANIQMTGSAEYVQAVVEFLDSSGKEITSVVGEASDIEPGTWTPLVGALGIAPANAVSTVLGVIAWNTSLGQETAVADPSLTASTVHGAAAVTGPLTTAGNQILDGNGKPLVLHGVQLSGLDDSPNLGSITEDTVAQAKAWGANMMRVSLGEQYWLPSSCAFDASYPSEVDQVVNWVTSLGMVAVLELSEFAVTPCGQAADYDMADSPGAVSFWNSVAARYADNPLVAFDLYNEPHDISDSVWLNGGIAWDGLVPYSVAGMQQLYSTVRAAGAKNLTFVSGNNWANSLPSTLVSGSNIAYGVHVYTCPSAAPPNCSNSDPYDPSPMLEPWVAPSATVPVIVSEFGWPSNSNSTYNAAVIAFAQAHGWGWNAFAWTVTAPWGLVATDPAGGPYEPTVSGMPVLAALAASP